MHYGCLSLEITPISDSQIISVHHIIAIQVVYKCFNFVSKGTNKK